MESVVEDNSGDIEAMLLCFADDDNDSSIASSEQVSDAVFLLSELFTESPVENELNDKNKNKLNSSSLLGKRKERRENNVGFCKKVKQSTAKTVKNQNLSTSSSDVVDDVMTALDDKQARLLTDIQIADSELEEGEEFDEGFLSLDDLEGNLGFDRDSFHQMAILDETSTEIPDLEDGLSYDEMLEILFSNDDERDISPDEFLLLLTDIRRFEGHDEENEEAQSIGYFNDK
ncbi:unnamed protein product [Dovyalis caffra]|uniref:Uncharacterized protein n=1 Tax=Dovyalis caffra TaxID=77055 RepID=A0AAV1R0P2_9ROSI|nr:unnamed protein product [Dovyalis caffra]